MDEVRERIRLRLLAAKADGTYVSESEQQAAWERKVAKAMPRSEAKDDGLVELLATSVERNAAVSFIRGAADGTFGQAAMWLHKVANDIENGEHR